MTEEEAAKEDSRRKRRKRSKGSQTSEENESAACSCHDCASMAHSIASMEKKLEKALRCIQEIESLKQEQSDLEIKNKELEESLDFANSKTATLEKKVADQDKAIGELKGGVKALTKQAEEAIAVVTISTFSIFQSKKMKRLLNLNLFFATLWKSGLS